MDEKTDWQIENKKIWTEALAPEFDWSLVPLTALSSVKDTAAYCRCMGHRDLKTVRKAVKKEILAKLNALLVKKGFQKDGTNIWRKEPDESAKRLSYARAKQSAGKPHLVTIEPKSGHGFLNSLKRMVGLSKHVETQVFRPIGSFVKSKAQSSVFLEFQSDRAGFCFFINVGIRPEGAHSAFASSLAVEAGGGLDNGYYMFRPVHFARDLASEIKPDQFHYVRLHEDPRYLPWVMDFIEKRMIACLELWTNPNPLALPRRPSQMVTPNHT